jgi:predicted enzyme related to lactoylglutathione lyase
VGDVDVLVEFPADDPERARRFWAEVLDLDLAPRTAAQGEGWEARGPVGRVGVHARAAGPGDSRALAYFPVADLPAALERVVALGGAVVHGGERWAVCRDSEGSPFGLAQRSAG